MSRNRVMVEVVSGKITRICKRMEPIHGGELKEWPRAEAVKAIRKQVWEICRDKHGATCPLCGQPLDEKTGAMHEQLPRSKGGEYSLENSIFICHGCHTLRQDSEHGDRRLRFGG